jgi:hypothetical protein
MKTILVIRRNILVLSVLFSIFTCGVYAQTGSDKTVTISAKELYEGLKNKTLKFDYNKEIIITGILKDTGSSFIYNSSYLLISDKSNGYIYVKAVLADKKKKSEYKKGQNIRIQCRFYEERDKVIVVKDAKNK